MDLIQRPRRLRGSETLRKMVRETRIDKSSLIYPLFVKEGTGIGLSLVKSLVKLHDGEVTVDSEIGKWTEFNIKIPNRTSIKESIDTYEKDLDRVEKIRIEFSDIYA